MCSYSLRRHYPVQILGYVLSAANRRRTPDNGCKGMKNYAERSKMSKENASGLCFSLDIVLAEQVLTVPHGIGALLDPVTQDEHTTVV